MKNSYVLLFVLAVFRAGCDEFRTHVRESQAYEVDTSAGQPAVHGEVQS